MPAAVGRSTPRLSWRPRARWAALVLVPFGLYLLWLSQTELPDGQCSGIGWGCSLAGWDAVAIAAVFYGAPIALIWSIGYLVVALVRRRRQRREPHRAQRANSS